MGTYRLQRPAQRVINRCEKLYTSESRLDIARANFSEGEIGRVRYFGQKIATAFSQRRAKVALEDFQTLAQNADITDATTDPLFLAQLVVDGTINFAHSSEIAGNLDPNKTILFDQDKE